MAIARISSQKGKREPLGRFYGRGIMSGPGSLLLLRFSDSWSTFLLEIRVGQVSFPGVRQKDHNNFPFVFKFYAFE